MKQNKIYSRREFVKWLTITGISASILSCQNTTNGILNPSQTADAQLDLQAIQDPTQISGEPSETLATTPERTLTTNPGSGEQIPVTTETPTNEPTLEQAYLSVARGMDASAITSAAIASLGGIERFVKPGHDVIIKPNICTNYYSFEYAATTNPEVVATLVQLCHGAGAGRIRVMDQPFAGSSQSAYAKSGIADAVAAAGGEMEVMNWNKYVYVEIPFGRDLQGWTFYKPVLDADVVINVPIAKHHGLAKLTLGGKNLMGVISDRPGMHSNIGQRVADLVSLIQPELTIIDAVRILLNNGPTDGNLNDVMLTNTVIASHDLVAADAYAATLFGKSGEEISYTKAGAEMGLGTLDLNAIRIEEISL